ncbi:MAG: hypothetical protein ACFFDN_41150 [Candidatus Hodarchaeota archaeon]
METKKPRQDKKIKSNQINIDSTMKNINRIYANRQIRNYFISKIHYLDKKAAEYILKDGEDAWERYSSLWKTGNKIWIKGKKNVYLLNCIDKNGCLCHECKLPVKFENAALHNTYYDFERVFSTATIVHKKCHKKGS